MREKLTAYVRNLFRNAADTPRNRDLEEEILQNTLDRFDDLVADGASPESAYAQAVANLGNVESLLDGPESVHYRPKPEPQKSKSAGRRGAIIAVVAIVCVLIVFLVGVLVIFGLNFTGHQSHGFGRYEQAEDRIEAEVDRFEESVEKWVDGVEHKVEDAVEQAIDNGLASFEYHYAGENHFRVGASEVEAGNVNRLVIDWVAGSVVVEPYDGDTISISEPEQEKEKNRLRWRQEGDTLTIRYCASTGNATASKKDLTVKLPMALANRLQYLQISTVSSNTQVSGLTAGELQFDSTSGFLQASGEYGLMDVDTTSGGMAFAGISRDVEIDTVSGDVTVACSETPNELSFDSTSGNLKLLLPERRSFEAELDTVSGTFRSDYGKTSGDELHYKGTESGSPAEFDFDTVSGDVSIEKATADKVSVS